MYTEKDEITINEEGEVWKCLDEWLDILTDDMESVHSRRINEFERKKFLEFEEELKAKFDDISKTEFFTKNQIDELNRKLDDFMEETYEKLSEYERKQKGIDKDFKLMQDEINDLKDKLIFMSSGDWLKMCFIRMYGLTQSPIGKIVSKSIQALLGTISSEIGFNELIDIDLSLNIDLNYND